LHKIRLMEKQKNIVAVNYINCTPEYQERFEQLFGTRAHAIDLMPGFVDASIKTQDRGRCLFNSEPLGNRRCL